MPNGFHIFHETIISCELYYSLQACFQLKKQTKQTLTFQICKMHLSTYFLRLDLIL